MLTIIRGLPGSGKSTFARDYFPGILVVEADMFAMRDGRYCFDPARLKVCHGAARRVVAEALSLRADVVITGTMTRTWEVEEYVKLADLFNSSRQIVVCRGQFKSVHNVPDETLLAMKARWEPFPGELNAESTAKIVLG